MTPATTHRMLSLAAAAAVLVTMAVAALATATPGRAATAATCVVHGIAAGDPAALRQQCPSAAPAPGSRTRSLGTSARRVGKPCPIAHLGAIDPAALRRAC